MQSASRGSPDSQHTSGGVELREDLPLKSGGGASAARCCASGPRLILAAFAALTAAITLALLTQIYYGDYEVVPHGSVSSSAAACSRAGTDALKAGGRALDAAAAAALCLAVLAPHRTSLDASGSLLYWEYRESRSQPAVLYEWGGAPGPVDRPPRLVAALAVLHEQLGALPWQQIVEPAIHLARSGFLVSEGLAAAGAAAGVTAAAEWAAGANVTAPELADYLTSIANYSSAELSAMWGASSLVRRSSPLQQRAGAWRALAGGAGAAAALGALAAALQPPPLDADDAQRRAVLSLQSSARDGSWAAGSGVATGLAVIDQRDTYIALVTGLSVPFGSGTATTAGAAGAAGAVGAGRGWARDDAAAPLDLAPAILLDDHVCGTRYVVGAESGSALAQASVALAGGAGAGAVERARVALAPGGTLAGEGRRPPPGAGALPPGAGAALLNASAPYAAVNVVQQRADALASHADSRGGGLASRF